VVNSDGYEREYVYVRAKAGDTQGQKRSDSDYQRWAFNDMQVHYFSLVQ
jgi:hypothetical protein